MSGKKLRIFLYSELTVVMVVTDLGAAGNSLKAAEPDMYQNEIRGTETKAETAGITVGDVSEVPEVTEKDNTEAETETAGLPEKAEGEEVSESTEVVPKGTEGIGEPVGMGKG